MATEIQESLYNFATFVNPQLIYDLFQHSNNNLSIYNHGDGHLDYSQYSEERNGRASPENGLKMSLHVPFKIVNYNNNNITVIDCRSNQDEFGTRTIDSGEHHNTKEEENGGEPQGHCLNMYKPYVHIVKNVNRTDSNHHQNTSFSGHHHSNNYNHHSNNHRPFHTDQTDRQAFGLMQRFRSSARRMSVSANPPANLLNGGPWDTLNSHIWTFYQGRVQSQQTYLDKLHLWKRLFVCVRRSLDPGCSLFLVGSTMSGFATADSDIDMCLLTRPHHPQQEPRMVSLQHLGQMRDLLLESALASKADLIYAKVPILKFQSVGGAAGLLQVDLNCNHGIGIRNTNLLYCYGRLDWRVRPLVVMVKLWAQANNINDAKTMTVSSYSWTLMVIHYLQCGISPAILPCLHTLAPEQFKSSAPTTTATSHHSNENEIVDVHRFPAVLHGYHSKNRSCLGQLLIGFLQYYAFFDYEQYAVSVRSGRRLPINQCKYTKAVKNDPGQWKCLCIEEPFDHTNTARSVYDPDAFGHIKQIMQASYNELARNKTLARIMPVDLGVLDR